METYLEGWASRDGAGSLEAMSRMGPSLSWGSGKEFAGYNLVFPFLYNLRCDYITVICTCVKVGWNRLRNRSSGLNSKLENVFLPVLSRVITSLKTMMEKFDRNQ